MLYVYIQQVFSSRENNISFLPTQAYMNYWTWLHDFYDAIFSRNENCADVNDGSDLSPRTCSPGPNSRARGRKICYIYLRTCNIKLVFMSCYLTIRCLFIYSYSSIISLLFL